MLYIVLRSEALGEEANDHEFSVSWNYTKIGTVDKIWDAEQN